MKKYRFFAVFVAAISAAMLLTACGEGEIIKLPVEIPSTEATTEPTTEMANVPDEDVARKQSVALEAASVLGSYDNNRYSGNVVIDGKICYVYDFYSVENSVGSICVSTEDTSVYAVTTDGVCHLLSWDDNWQLTDTTVTPEPTAPVAPDTTEPNTQDSTSGEDNKE